MAWSSPYIVRVEKVEKTEQEKADAIRRQNELKRREREERKRREQREKEEQYRKLLAREIEKIRLNCIYINLAVWITGLILAFFMYKDSNYTPIIICMIIAILVTVISINIKDTEIARTKVKYRKRYGIPED